MIAAILAAAWLEGYNSSFHFLVVKAEIFADLKNRILADWCGYRVSLFEPRSAGGEITIG